MNKYRKSKIIPSYEELLREISAIDNTIEKSYASKCLHLLYHPAIIVDSRLIKKLNIQNMKSYKKDKEYKIKESCRIWNEIGIEIEKFKRTKKGKEIIQEFRETYPNIRTSPEKIIDFYLWSK